MGNTPNISGMVADPQFQGLSLTDKRAALGKVTGDATFGKLSDADTMQFLSKFSAPKPTLPTGSYQTKKGGPILNSSGAGFQSQNTPTLLGATGREGALGLASGLTGMPESQNPVGDFVGNLKAQGQQMQEHPIASALPMLLGPAPQLYQMGKQMAGSAGELGQGVASGNAPEAAHGGGQLIGQVAQLGLMKESAESQGTPGNIRKLIASKMYEPEGALSSWADAIAHPTKLPEKVLKALIPENPSYPGAPLPSAEEFYANKAADLSKRGTQQAVLDRQAASAGKAVPITKSPNFSPEAYRAGAASRTPGPAPSSPFGDATSSAPGAVNPVSKVETDSLGIRWAVGPDGLRVSIPKAVPDAEIPSYAASKLDEQRSILSGIKGSTTPPGPNIQMVNKFSAPEPSRIVTPESAPPPVKVTYQSYPREALYQMAKQGNIEAGMELIRNPKGFPLPPNFKFLIEEGAKKIPWRNLEQ